MPTLKNRSGWLKFAPSNARVLADFLHPCQVLAYMASAIEVDRLELLKTNGHYIIGPHALNRRLGWKKYHHEKRPTRILDTDVSLHKLVIRIFSIR